MSHLLTASLVSALALWACSESTSDSEISAANATSPSAQCSNSNGTLDMSGYKMKIVSINVSHGDATFFVLPNGETMLMDTGQHFAVKDLLFPFLEKHHVKKIDHFFVSHYHGDHDAGKLIENGKVVLGYKYGNQRIPVGKFYDYKSFKRGQRINFGGAEMLVLNSYHNNPNAEENHKSLSFRLEYKDFVYAIGGDIYGKQQDEILNDPGLKNNVRSHVYRTNHHMHGSTSTSYLYATDPYLFITSGEKAVYDRSAYTSDLSGVVTRLKSEGRRFKESLLTLEHGNIVLGINGGNSWTYGCTKQNQSIQNLLSAGPGEPPQNDPVDPPQNDPVEPPPPSGDQYWVDPYSGQKFRICTGSNPDPDGNGWGWEKSASCKVQSSGGSGGQQTEVWRDPSNGRTFPYCSSNASDPDGDGWGWENNKSCKVR